MNMLWPGFLFLLGLIPLIIAAYLWILRRRRRFAVRYSSLSLVRAALPQQSLLRRHLPFALFLAALSSLVIAAGRPVATVAVPASRATIILAIDVSRSMCAIDIPPNRLEAAKDAALSFIQRQQSGPQIGIVAFAGFAGLVQPPTTDQDALEAAIEGLTTARRTAIGSGILKSIDAIAEVDDNIAPSVSDPVTGDSSTPGPSGIYAPHIIVLLTDGASNSGPEPLDAAQQAVERGIRVFTIGFGTDDENVAMPFCGQAAQGDFLFNGGGGGGLDPQFGGYFRRGIDEGALKRVADATGGTYYAATSAGELQEVFNSLPTSLIMKEETTEISVGFAAVGALLAAIAILLSLIWYPVV